MPTNTNTNTTDDVAIDIDRSAIAAAADLAEEEDIDIEAINGSRARQGTTFVSKCGVVTACAALGTLIGVGSFHLAGPPTRNTSSKQVAITSEEITIDGFTKVGDGDCLDGAGEPYDSVEYVGVGVADAEACANECLDCPGGGQFDSNGDTLLLRGFLLNTVSIGFCRCYVENTEFPGGSGSPCFGEGAFFSEDGNGGTGEIKSSSGADNGECWKVNSKNSKSPKRG